ncbi:DUF3040 domain-containing protein [Pseudonocardia sp. RS11V-5]|uniref:DUF3040 domain-containing protein n=1 Tax=Pseudonocardia terrae TaxID=2905831 RepID=UPI001E4F44EE|nr:DUF3040 domain-containing protein [Pseudonocardia terrae]MCE3556569.1 DUF3040 domain-containing protein [Pseudonocardia terrae]
MLDDHDHHALDELEWQLSLDDPDFVLRFQRDQDQMAEWLRRRRGHRIAVITALTTGVLLVPLGSPAGALAAVLATGLVWMTWRFPKAFGRSP